MLSHFLRLAAAVSAAACLLLLSGCAQNPPQAPAEGTAASLADEGLSEAAAFDYDQLMLALREKGKLLLVYGAQEPQYAKRYRAVAEQIAQSLPRFEVLVRSDGEVQEDDFRQLPVFLLGTPRANRWIVPMMARTAFSCSDTGFVFRQKHYGRPSDLFLLGLAPNPFAPKLPLVAMSGNADGALLDYLDKQYGGNWRRVLWQAWGYQIVRNGQRAVLGEFVQPDGRQALLWDFEEGRRAGSSTPTFEVHLQGAVLAQEAQRLVADCEANAQALLRAVGKPAGQRLRLFLYASSEEKALQHQEMAYAHADTAAMTIHATAHPAFSRQRPAVPNALLLRQLLGVPRQPWLELGTAIAYTPQWQRLGALHWAGRLHAAGYAWPLSAFRQAPDFRQESPLVAGAYAGAWVHFLLAVWGEEDFFGRYARWMPTAAELEALQPRWMAFLDQQAQASAPRRTRRPWSGAYVKGFNFAHEGYRIYNGYGSGLARESLARLQGLACNAVALVPYTYLPDPHLPAPLELVQWAGSETDEALVHSAYDARQAGMTVLLKPQVWLGQGAWPGDVAMRSEADWQAFFGHYRRWIFHYVLLAEIHELDALCLGVEFVEATLSHPEVWVRMAEQSRAVFGGALTYAANWGREAEANAIWPAFDFIGVNCYYPLSQSASPSDAELQASFRRTLHRLDSALARHGKSLIFTEIGFRSVAEAWKNPHAEAGERAASPEVQARCYRAVCEVLEEAPWCRGVYWWKWPSYLRYAHENPATFAPAGKPAEAVVEQWFRKKGP